MALLPARNILDGSSIPTTGTMKTAMGSLRDYLAGLLGTDSTDTATARTALGAAKSGTNTDITSLSGVTSVNGGPLSGLRNLLINPSFSINQREYVSGAAVGAARYGHDRWRMAASGDTYTFSTTANVTTITIPSGKVLRQVVEGLNLVTGTYCLSWSGTAQGKIGAGSYGASGVTGAITGGTDTMIEFGPGTISKVQLEFGSTATIFEQRPYGLELLLCQRYARPLTINSSLGQAYSTVAAYLLATGVPMRSNPTLPAVTGYSITGTLGNLLPVTAFGSAVAMPDGSVIIPVSVASGLVAGSATFLGGAPNGTTVMSAEL